MSGTRIRTAKSFDIPALAKLDFTKNTRLEAGNERFEIAANAVALHYAPQVARAHHEARLCLLHRFEQLEEITLGVDHMRCSHMGADGRHRT